MTNDTIDIPQLGKTLRSFATHHDHGHGWTYTRDSHGIKHIRYDNDWKGRLSLLGRINWTAKMIRHLNDRTSFRPKGIRDWCTSIRATIAVNMRTENHRPDGTLNNGIVMVVWEEDGEYIEWVGPTVGEKIADFLEAEPTHPHAIAIATEMVRVRQLGIDRRKDEPVVGGSSE